MSGMQQDLILDGTKIGWYQDRIEAWERGERIAPVTIDMALTRSCNFACTYCYAMLQENERSVITEDVITRFLDDCAEIGVKGISFVSDGESTISPVFSHAVRYGHSLGLSMAVGTNGFVLNRRKLEDILPHLTYLRINITAGEPKRYAEIMGVKEEWFHRVCENIRVMAEIKQRDGLPVTIGMQMVLMPEFKDQILPLSHLGKSLGADYLVIKHCSDNEDGALGVDYKGYRSMYDDLRSAEALSDDRYLVKVKWSKIEEEGKRSYQRCFGAPFMIQLSGSGLVAPCGMLFNERYKRFHIGNICEERFKDIWNSDRYWEVMNHLASPAFNAQTMCGSLCLQHRVNTYLDERQKGRLKIVEPEGPPPQHLHFL
jgi:MoaA/NifB/PqqE/SkfB family radical SAM enzyme